MKAKELIGELKGYEDFDIEFVFSEKKADEWPTYRIFSGVEIVDIGHSDKIIRLTGNES